MNATKYGCRALLVIAIWSFGCGSPALTLTPPAHASPVLGEPISVEHIGAYSHFTLRALFWWEGLAASVPTEHGIELYRIEYWTSAPDESVVRASGLLALPKRVEAFRGVVSWQHGTASLRTAAPSALDASNGLLPAAFFAGHGYILIAPDYLGFGTSEEPHAYYHTASMARNVVDLLRATKTVLQQNRTEWPDHLYLAGFSQGGHASMAAQRLLEAEPLAGLRVTAAAPVAGAVDLAHVGIPAALEGRSRFASLYVAWVAQSYIRIYGEPADSVFRAPWASVASELFDGQHDGDSIVEALPTDPRLLLTDDVLDAIAAGQPHWFLDRLAENELVGWTPASPVRLYYGELDVDVTPEQALLMQQWGIERGADVVAVDVGEVDHEGSILPAARMLRDWFDSLSAPRSSPRSD